LWWKIVKVLVHWLTWVDLVLDAIKTSHQHCGKAEVWVLRWVWEANFKTLSLRVRAEWNTARSRAVTCRIGQKNWSFISWNQALVGVGCWVCEGVQCLSMLDDTANKVEAVF